MIKARDISRLKAGELPHSLENTPFIIMREMVRMRCVDGSGWEWKITDSPDPKSLREITKEIAMKIIACFGMTKVLNESDGQIYEMPGKPFLKKYGKTS